MDENQDPQGRHGHGPAHGHGPGRRRGLRGRTDTAVRVAGDALHVRRVFGEPVQQDGVTLVPVALVTGAAGSGWGTGELGGGASTDARGEGTGAGGGGGFGVRARPVGVYVVRGSDVSWEPALDLGRVIVVGQVVTGVAALALAWALRARRRHH
ncbi:MULTISPECIES: spore germination protein GerW family protein [unclassified Actinotalea]|uniref:spore germination protein GerW family protein n=1 Tax=unclassified Actinotalea TaxID=2638618 RepID=UPI001C7109BC|nr:MULTISPECIES: spore germination protein GerW family protein [unclassified Actinotalea]